MKFKVAGVFSLPQLFPGQTSMWSLTAAQRALLLGRSKEEEERAEKIKKMPERYSMDRILEIVENENRRQAAINGEISPQEGGA